MKRALTAVRLKTSGLSLVELMVAMAIGLVVTLAIFSVLVASEDRKRTSTSVNDMNQTGAYVSYTLDKAIRSAGSGFVQRWRDVFGCRINVSRGGQRILPSADDFPEPFASVSASDIRMAPVLIHRRTGAGESDVLAVMTGTSGFSESPLRIQPGSVEDDGLRLPNTLEFTGGDLVMLAEDGVGCLVQQVASPFAGSSDQLLPLAGTYHATTGADASLTTFGAGGIAYVIPLGNPSRNNPPQFQLFAVGENNTLFSYDLLRTTGNDQAIPIAEGVVELRAVYGVDMNDDGVLDGWRSPATAPFDAASLSSGSAAAQQNLRRIVAIRVGLIVRTNLVERDQFEEGGVAPGALSLFEDLGAGLTYERPLSSEERLIRHRTIEMTIPLRNVLLLPVT